MTTAKPEVTAVRAGEELDWPALERHLRAALGSRLGLAEDAPFSVLQFPHGSANLTYRVSIGETHLVVRRPPFGRIAPGAHDMAREHKVLASLGTAYSRAPLGLLHCADPGVIGAEFLVSEYRAGVVVWDALPAPMSALPDAGHHVGLAVVEALADLHEVDQDACGLADLGRPEGYLERQLSGWGRRWDAVAPDGTHPASRVGRALAARMPRRGDVGILHNDFKLDNCQLQPDDPTRVTSVFDWDMATLGDPLADLGTLLNYWPQAGQPTAVPGLEELGLPHRDAVVERYVARRGLVVDDAEIDWYEAFGCWKTAIILQQLYARYLRGETTDVRMRERGAVVAPLAERALRLLGAA